MTVLDHAAPPRARSLRQDVAEFLFRPECRRAPQSFYDRLVTTAPVLPVDASRRLWLISGHDEIVAMSTSPLASGDFAALGIDLGRGFGMADLLARMLPLRSGADHARLRRLVSSAFGARAAQRLRDDIGREVSVLLTPHLAAGRLDVRADLADTLPPAISCAMLDVPATDRSQVIGWATLVSRALYLPDTPDSVRAELDRELPRLRSYVADLCHTRADRPGEDLVSLLVAARAAGTLDTEDLVAFVVMLFVNGLETLTSALTVAARQLIHRPQLAPRIREDAGYAAAFFDESVRLDSPVRGSGRAVHGDLTIAGETLPAGSVALMLYAAANRDPRRYPEPGRFDPQRPDRRHLGFGHGPHRCVGAPISLVAGAEVLQQLAALPGLRSELAPADEQWDTSLVFGGLRALPVTFDPPARPEGAAP